MLCGNLYTNEGKEIKKGEGNLKKRDYIINIIADSLCCTAEMNTAL